MKRQQFRARTGFTLIEIMVAIAIFAMVVAAIYSTWAVIMKASAVGQAAAARVQRQRVAIRTIENALTCIQSFQASLKYYTFLVQNGNSPEFSFSARLPDDFPRNGKFGDFNVRRLTFSLEAASGFSQERDLVLRQSPILMDMSKDEQDSPLILARNVKKFAIQCCDTNTGKWVDEWDKTNQIPSLIMIDLVFGSDSGGKNQEGSSLEVTRLVSIPSAMMPAVVQMPFGGVRPGGPGLPFGLPTGAGPPGSGPPGINLPHP